MKKEVEISKKLNLCLSDAEYKAFDIVNDVLSVMVSNIEEELNWDEDIVISYPRSSSGFTCKPAELNVALDLLWHMHNYMSLNKDEHYTTIEQAR